MHFRSRTRSFVAQDHEEPDDDDNNDAAAVSSKQDEHHELYAILHLPRDADVPMIQRHFKLLSRVYHPDKIVLPAAQQQQQNGMEDSDPQQQQQRTATAEGAGLIAQEAFVAIKTAADVLSDPVYRLAYRYGGMLAVTLVKRSQQQAAAASAATTTTKTSSNQDDNDYDNDSDDDNNSTTAEDLYTALQQASTEIEAMQLVQQVLEEHALHQQHAASQRPHWDATCSFPTLLLNNPHSNTTAWQRDGAASSLAVHSRYYPVSTKDRTVSTTVSATATTETTGETNVTVGAGIEGPVVRGTHVVVDGTWNLTSTSSARAPQLQIRTNRQTATGTVVVAALGGPVRQFTQWNMSFLAYRNLQFPFGRHDNETTNTTNTQLQALWRLAMNVRGQLRHLSLTLRTIDETMPIWRCRLALAAYPVKLSWKSALEEDGGDADDSIFSSSCFYAAYSWAPVFWRAKVLRIHRWYVGGTGSHHPSHHHNHHYWTVKYGLKLDGKAWVSGNPLWTVLCTLESHALTLRLPIGLVTNTAVTTAATTTLPPPILWMASLLWAQWVDQYVLAHLSSILFPDQQQQHRPQKSQRNENGWNTTSWWSDRDDSTTTAAAFPLHRDDGTTLQYYRSVIRYVALKKAQPQTPESGASSSPPRPVLVIVSAVLQLPQQQQQPQLPWSSSSHHDSSATKVVVTELLQFCAVEDQLHLTWDDPRWNWWLGLPQRQPSQTTTSENQPSSSDGGMGIAMLFSHVGAWLHQWRTKLGVWSSTCESGSNREPPPDKVLHRSATTSTAFQIPPSSPLYIRYQYRDTLYEVNLVSPSSDRNHPEDDSNYFCVHLPHADATALGPCDRVS